MCRLRSGFEEFIIVGPRDQSDCAPTIVQTLLSASSAMWWLSSHRDRYHPRQLDAPIGQNFALSTRSRLLVIHRAKKFQISSDRKSWLAKVCLCRLALALESQSPTNEQSFRSRGSCLQVSWEELVLMQEHLGCVRDQMKIFAKKAKTRLSEESRVQALFGFTLFSCVKA